MVEDKIIGSDDEPSMLLSQKEFIAGGKKTIKENARKIPEAVPQNDWPFLKKRKEICHEPYDIEKIIILMHFNLNRFGTKFPGRFFYSF